VYPGAACVQHRRQRRLEPGAAGHLTGQQDRDPDHEERPVADQATRRVAAQALRRQLSAALASLSPADRDVLLLVTDGLGYAEIAQALGIPAGTVASRLSRARKKVREALGGANPAEPRTETSGG